MGRTWLSLFSTQLDEPDMQDFMSNITMTMDEWIKEILQLVAVDVTTYLRSYTSKMNPPRYKRKYTYNEDQQRVRVTKKMMMDPARPAHPGGWSDVEGDLKAGYYGRVDAAPEGGWKLTIGNRDPDAIYVEAKEGLWVITGLFDPNGPVAKAIQKYIKKHAPGSKVTFNAGSGDGIVDTVTAAAL